MWPHPKLRIICVLQTSPCVAQNQLAWVLFLSRGCFVSNLNLFMGGCLQPRFLSRGGDTSRSQLVFPWITSLLQNGVSCKPYGFFLQILNQLEVVKEFLRNNEDLRNGLTQDMQKLDSLYLQHQKLDSKEPGAQAPEGEAWGKFRHLMLNKDTIASSLWCLFFYVRS